MERVQEFLQCDELKFNTVKYDRFDPNSISIKDANFYWGFQKFQSSKKKGKRGKKLKKDIKFKEKVNLGIFIGELLKSIIM